MIVEKNGGSITFSSDGPYSKSYTLTFTEDDIYKVEEYNMEIFLVEVDFLDTNTNIIFWIIPKEAVGVDLNDREDTWEIFYEAGIHTPFMTTALVPFYNEETGEYDETLHEGATYVSVSLTINDYTDFPTTQTLKPVHLPDTISSKSYVSDSISTAIEAAIGGSY